MIIFEGDFVRLTGNQEWLEVVDIVDSMNIRLSNGFCVEATERYIGQVLSANEFLEVEVV
jgi:hypothetical protein